MFNSLDEFSSTLYACYGGRAGREGWRVLRYFGDREARSPLWGFKSSDVGTFLGVRNFLADFLG